MGGHFAYGFLVRGNVQLSLRGVLPFLVISTCHCIVRHFVFRDWGRRTRAHEPLYPWSATTGWRCRWSLVSLPVRKACLCPCPVKSGRVGGSPGKHGWSGMPALQRLAPSRSRCSAFQTPSLAFSAWQLHKAAASVFPLLGAAWLFRWCSHFLPVSLQRSIWLISFQDWGSAWART